MALGLCAFVVALAVFFRGIGRAANGPRGLMPSRHSREIQSLLVAVWDSLVCLLVIWEWLFGGSGVPQRLDLFLTTPHNVTRHKQGKHH